MKTILPILLIALAAHCEGVELPTEVSSPETSQVKPQEGQPENPEGNDEGESTAGNPDNGNEEGSSEPATIEPPVFSHAPGHYTAPFNLEITSAEGSIRYTLDDSEPTAENGLSYIGPIAITQTTTVRAIAVNNGTSVTTGGVLELSLADTEWDIYWGWNCGSGVGGSSYFTFYDDGSTYFAGFDWQQTGPAVSFTKTISFCKPTYSGTLNADWTYISGSMVNGGDSCECDSGIWYAERR